MRTKTILTTVGLAALLMANYARAQANSDGAVLEGTVVNNLTNQPIGRALVLCGDARCAAFTDDQGHFEFNFPRVTPARNTSQNGVSTSAVPSTLTAKHPGFLEGTPPVFLTEHTHRVTIRLTPESLIVGKVELSSNEVRSKLGVSLYRKGVNEGRAQWTQVNQALTRSNGEFRFAGLEAGEYRVFTNEELDRDPEDTIPGGLLYGYPPVYYPAASDFEASTVIRLGVGKTAEVSLTVTKQKYFPVAVPVENASGPVMVRVGRNGSSSPGYDLGFSPRSHRIEGLLPDGTYKVQAFTFSPPTMSGSSTVTVRGGAAQGAPLVLVPGVSIPVEVREEFRQSDPPPVAVVGGGRNRGDMGLISGVELLHADGSPSGSGALRRPKRPGETMVIEGVHAGRYWVNIVPLRGYTAAVNAGGVDLLQNPLEIGQGGSAPTIEVTLRDGTATLRGTIEGSRSTQPKQEAAPADGSEPAYVYCVPLPDSSGRLAVNSVSPNEEFNFQGLVPGTYRILAFTSQRKEFEYRNPDAMKAYETKGLVLRLVEGQTETIRLPLITEEP